MSSCIRFRKFGQTMRQKTVITTPLVPIGFQSRDCHVSVCDLLGLLRMIWPQFYNKPNWIKLLNDKEVVFSGGHPTTTTGLLILSGLIVFVVAEKSFTVIEKLGERHLATPENNNVKGYALKHIPENNKKQVRRFGVGFLVS